MVQKKQPVFITVHCDNCGRTYDIGKSNHPESWPCFSCNSKSLRLAE